ncbi:CheW-like domain protein [Vibrio ruber DSM 16370]|uniref:CheW-like domain protein n=1 Tax=Vibrio ruber (strain DSM 16370 / JCM 11486 / BCRC 17186 / CECT 7878 / LMG 23124 / VR1) TaxID=1123498 RepID=A0A1R4LDR1_VIBR1|nr:chemotaxis protein CheW [Vibrio ruber]SJN54706.1 CheW-like domain protein [Vibrio ruber DSM 16370]
MNRDVALSSEQALDDYFAALLDEEAGELELVQEKNAQVSQDAEVVPQLQTQRVSVTEEPEIYQNEALFPNLEDVQRLLNQLESSNPVDEIEDIAALLDKNTQEISAHQETRVEEDEIQDWDIDLQSEEVIEVATPSEVETLADDVQEEEIATAEIMSEPLAVEPEVVTQTAEVEDVQENIEQETQPEPQTQVGGTVGDITWYSTERAENFQVLYFEVNEILFAVPLDELGGIHRLEKVSHLIGRPQWYLGLQTNREQQLDVVDTARWVMAEKLKDDDYKESYQYIVMLGDSSWGLACDQLRGTESLNPEKVRWREQAGKRPWLAGMVKEKMCALIHVEALTAMLKAGLDVKALDND